MARQQPQQPQRSFVQEALDAITRRKPVSITILVPHEMAIVIDALKEREGVSRADIVRASVNAFLKQLKEEESNV